MMKIMKILHIMISLVKTILTMIRPITKMRPVSNIVMSINVIVAPLPFYFNYLYLRNKK